MYVFPVWLDPTEQKDEDLMIAPVENEPPGGGKEMSFQRQAGWP